MSSHVDVAALLKSLGIEATNSGAHDGRSFLETKGAGTITSTKRAAALANNYNLMLPFGTSDSYVSPGYNAAGRQINQIVSVHWFVTRLIEGLQALKQTYDANGDKIPLSTAGQGIVESVLRKQFSIGAAAGHFFPEDQGGLDLTFPETISTTDLSNGVLRTERFRVR